MKKVNWLITDNNITVNYDGQTYIVSRSDKFSEKLIEAIKSNNLDEIPNLVSAEKRIKSFSKGNFTVQDDKVLINGVEASPVLSRKIINFANEGLPYEPLVKFATKLQNNPSFRAVQELFTFLEKNDHPITESGNFIAYKRVQADFTDIHSGTFDNSVGKTVEMPRNQVNEDSTQTCSNGLHVANWDYAHTKFGSNNRDTDIMLEVEVDPSDVVSIPVDYFNSKMRVCSYTVLGVVDKELSAEVQLRVVDKNYSTSGANDDFGTEVYDECMDCGSDCEDGYDRCEDCEIDYEAARISDEKEDFTCEDTDCSCQDESETEDKYPWETET